MKYIIDRNDDYSLEITKGKHEIIVKKNINANIFDHLETDAQIDLLLEENSFVNYVSIDNSNEGNISRNIKVFRNASLKMLLTDFAQKSNKEVEVALDEENATIELIDIVIGKKSVNDFKINISHDAPYTTSKVENYIIADEAMINILVEGKIKKGMEKANCSQKSRGIVASDNSKITVLPTLLIDEYDVMANHGCSIGKIDEEGLYYLMSRGITKKEAEALIINGFLNPIIDGIEEEKIKEELLNKTQTKL